MSDFSGPPPFNQSMYSLWVKLLGFYYYFATTAVRIWVYNGWPDMCVLRGSGRVVVVGILGGFLV